MGCFKLPCGKKNSLDLCENFKENDHVFKKHGHFLSFLAPPVGLEPTTLRLTARFYKMSFE